ncbi:MAG: hypothetical protein IFJ97_01775 [Acidobacteria bacterium]|uniref:Uncharacterized protein n=1 Tax=Candidatus Sulfomarinibacter kjeldsenii TaxID=2885994 RepID=A0A8J6XWF6_9BACT|nr:hypothetical protein [Candidatus Sulfomarinibacter kjeldsenii]
MKKFFKGFGRLILPGIQRQGSSALQAEGQAGQLGQGAVAPAGQDHGNAAADDGETEVEAEPAEVAEPEAEEEAVVAPDEEPEAVAEAPEAEEEKKDD